MGWFERLLEERQELIERMQKLQEFLREPAKIDEVALELLREQYDAMIVYHSVLDRRVALHREGE